MKNGILRGKLLRLLHDMYPDSMEQGSIIGIYYQYHSVDSIRKSLQYLLDKGLIIVNVVPHPYREGLDVVYYKISPAGVDLVEGNATVKDVGVVLPVEEYCG